MTLEDQAFEHLNHPLSSEVLYLPAFFTRIGAELFNEQAQRNIRKVLKILFDRKSDQLIHFAEFTFSQPLSHQWRTELQKLLQTNNQVILKALAANAFSQPHSVTWREELSELINLSEHKTLKFSFRKLSQNPTAKIGHQKKYKLVKNFFTT